MSPGKDTYTEGKRSEVRHAKTSLALALSCGLALTLAGGLTLTLALSLALSVALSVAFAHVSFGDLRVLTASYLFGTVMCPGT